MSAEKLFSEKTLRLVLRQYITGLYLPEQASRRILCALLKKPPP